MANKTAEVTVRPKRAKDQAFVLSLSRRVFSPYSVDPARTVTAMLSVPDTEVGIAELGRGGLGFVVMSCEQLDRSFGPWSRPAAAHIDAIAVRPDAEGRGVGRRLLEWAEQ